LASLTDWIKTHIFRRTVENGTIADVPFTDDEFANLLRQGAEIQRIAFDQCVLLIANAIGKCEFKTYMDGEEVFGDEYYLWNVAPNVNQGSSEFIHKWIKKLMTVGEALVIEMPGIDETGKRYGQLLVADSYTVDQYATKEATFRDITFNGRGNAPMLMLNREFLQHEVLYFKMPAGNTARWVGAFLANYQKLLDYSMNAFIKSRGSHGVLYMKGLNAGNDEQRAALLKAYSEAFKDFYDKESSAMPLDDAMRYEELSQKTYSNEQSRDIRALIDDVRDVTAQAFGIPPEILNGKVEGTADAIDNFLTFCIDPLCVMMQEEITAKRYGRKGFASGGRVKIDTSRIKHIDIMSTGDAIDKLISSGAFTINQVRRKLGEDQISEPFADQHYITKNYEPIEMAGQESPGGSPDGTGGNNE
jgi:HK97 family phage portal protein